MMENQTSKFLVHEYAWANASIELHDVQPLFGGLTVRLPRWSGFELFVSRIAPNGTETNYRLRLGWDDKRELCRLFVQHDFLTIEPENRPGIPDEARPTIRLTNSRGESHTVAKWSGVSDGRFDPIYHALLALAERTEGQKPIPPRFNKWQKGATIGAIVVVALLLLLLAYRGGQAVVALWWPDQLGLLSFWLLFLTAMVLPLIGGLAVLERHKARWTRTYTHTWVIIPVNLLFSLALICLVGFGQTAVSHWLSPETAPFPAEDQRLYVVIGYTAVFAIGLLLVAARLSLTRLHDLMDTRF